ncbi:spore coat protein [Acetonema longum]|uniref:DUF892 family protein n=1 Tax=Acetonema longum DSM 6540 TaxID=1009370 RepID=F7NHV7_9FIRM|nr:spore coat protein [Acetonema longum]EGO64370.1 hypothetical protein ALO_08275 [Acetonema longum DSM 6540]
MTVLDKMNFQTSQVFHSMFDKETPNYLEAASLFAIIAQGRHTAAVLSVLYNQARDPGLRKLIKQAIEDQNRPLIERCEKLLQDGGGKLPRFRLSPRELKSESGEYPPEVTLTDEEILISLASMAKAAQMAILGAMQQCYQPNMARVFHDALDSGLDFGYRLMQYALDRGMLPHLEKIEH